jgi:hypothetical protein
MISLTASVVTLESFSLCHLASTSKHLKHWRSATNKVKSWILLNKESETVHPPPSQTGWLITVGAVQQVWSKVSDEKFRYYETRT